MTAFICIVHCLGIHVRITRLAILGSSPVVLRLPSPQAEASSAPPWIVLGPNGSGKSLLVKALLAAFAPDAERAALCADLSEGGFERIEVDFLYQNRKGCLVCQLPDGARETTWGPVEPTAINELAPVHLQDNGTAPERPSDFLPSEVFARFHVVAAGRLTVPGDTPIAEDVERVLRRPLEFELDGWRTRQRELRGEHGDGGKLAVARADWEEATLAQERSERLHTALAAEAQRRQELELRIAETYSRVQVLYAEAEDLDKVCALANRAVRLETWIAEIRQECYAVLQLREQHESLQARLERVDENLRKAPDDLGSLIEQFVAATVRERELVAEITGLHVERTRMAMEVQRVQEELAMLAPPEDDSTVVRAEALLREIDAAKIELTSLLRGRIELVRQREGVQQQLQHEFAPVLALKSEDLCVLDEFAAAGEASSAGPKREAALAALGEAREKATQVRAKLRERFADFQAYDASTVGRLRDYHDLRRLQATLRGDLDGLRARGAILKRKSRRQPGIFWTLLVAIAVFAATAKFQGWDIGLLAGITAGGLMMLLFGFLWTRARRERDAVSAAEAMTQKSHDDVTADAGRLERALGPLALMPSLDKALARLREYLALCDERERWDTTVADLVEGETPAATDDIPAEFARRLPPPLSGMSAANLRRLYQDFQKLEWRFNELQADWAAYAEGGAAARRIVELEDKVTARTREHAELTALLQQRRQAHETARAELAARLNTLEQQAASRQLLVDRESQIAGIRARMSDLNRAAGGLLANGDLDGLQAVWSEREELRQQLRDVRRAVSARQTYDELRARETLLNEEAAEVRQRLGVKDPLYLLHGETSEYAAKYAGQEQIIRGGINEVETERRRLQLELESLRLEDLETELAAQRPLDDLRREASLFRDRVDSLERDLMTTQELITAIVAELNEIGHISSEQLNDAINRQLRRLSGERLFEIQFSDGTGWMVTAFDGTTRRLASLSDGLQDLVRLSVRLGVLDTIQSCDTNPVVWDEPFAHLDDAHLQRVRDALNRLATERQVILLTRHAVFETWGTPVSLTAEERDTAWR